MCSLKPLHALRNLLEGAFCGSSALVAILPSRGEGKTLLAMPRSKLNACSRFASCGPTVEITRATGKALPVQYEYEGGLVRGC